MGNNASPVPYKKIKPVYLLNVTAKKQTTKKMRTINQIKIQKQIKIQIIKKIKI